MPGRNGGHSAGRPMGPESSAERQRRPPYRRTGAGRRTALPYARPTAAAATDRRQHAVVSTRALMADSGVRRTRAAAVPEARSRPAGVSVSTLMADPGPVSVRSLMSDSGPVSARSLMAESGPVSARSLMAESGRAGSVLEALSVPVGVSVMDSTAVSDRVDAVRTPGTDALEASTLHDGVTVRAMMADPEPQMTHADLSAWALMENSGRTGVALEPPIVHIDTSARVLGSDPELRTTHGGMATRALATHTRVSVRALIAHSLQSVIVRIRSGVGDSVSGRLTNHPNPWCSLALQDNMNC